MAPSELYDLPWLDWEGQSVPQILACAKTHRVDSLLVAITEAIEARESGRISPEERVVLSIEALQREVNNGGYHQFFTNASSQYAPVIVDSLRISGLEEVATITERAIDLLGVEQVTAETVAAAAEQALEDENDELLDALEACDEQYYNIAEIDQKLFDFAATHLGRPSDQ